MSKPVIVSLTDDQREYLRAMICSGTHSARVLTRARILLLSDRSQGQKRTASDIAKALLVSEPTVGKTRRRFAFSQEEAKDAEAKDGLNAALFEKPRPGKTPKVTGDIEAHLVTLCCSEPPEGAARWTLRLLANKIVADGHLESLSHVTVGERLKKMNSNPGA